MKNVKLFTFEENKDGGTCSACNGHNIDPDHRLYKVGKFYNMRTAHSNVVSRFCEDCLIVLSAVITAELTVKKNEIVIEDY